MKYLLLALNNQIRLLTEEIKQLHAYLKDYNHKLEMRDSEAEKLQEENTRMWKANTELALQVIELQDKVNETKIKKLMDMDLPQPPTPPKDRNITNKPNPFS